MTTLPVSQQSGRGSQGGRSRGSGNLVGCPVLAGQAQASHMSGTPALLHQLQLSKQ